MHDSRRGWLLYGGLLCPRGACREMAELINVRTRVQTAVSNDWYIAISISDRSSGWPPPPSFVHCQRTHKHTPAALPFRHGEAFAIVPKIQPSLLPYSFLVLPTAMPSASWSCVDEISVAADIVNMISCSVSQWQLILLQYQYQLFSWCLF